MSTRTRGVAALTAALLAAVLLVGVQPAAASHYTNTTELTGSSNAAAAASWSKATFATSTTEVLLGRDDLFADSLASGGMQGSRPLLLTKSQTLSAEASGELDRLDPTVVNIMGGTSAVSAAVEEELKSDGYTVRRFSGPTRIETAIDVARRALPTATSGIVAAAFEPPNTDPTRAFADSIAAGGWAADRNMPVLLTESQRLSTSTKNYLRTAAIRTISVVGGTSAVSDAVVTELRQLGMTVTRVSGPTRFDTAVAIAKQRGFADASKATEVILNEGQAADAWASGFAAAGYAAAKNAPIVLSNGSTVPTPTASWLAPSGKAPGTKLVCAPGVGSEACDAASEAMGHTAVTGSTPRLLAAAVGTTTQGVTQVKFTFTEPLAAQVSAGKFKVYAYDNVPTVASAAARDATRQDVVVASFDAGDLEGATVAAVAFEAVRGLSSNVANAEGAASLQAHTLAAGDTRGPDLVSVSEESATEVLFDFDQPVSSCGANSGYKLVKTQGTAPNLTVLSGSQAAGNAVKVDADTCRAKFSTDVGWGTVGRAFVVAATVVGDGVYKNPPGKASRVGLTPAPDIEQIATVGTNQVRFTFDDPIDSAVNVDASAGKFKVHDSRGRVWPGVSAALDATQQPGNITGVIVTFDSGDMRNVIIGASVEAGAVKRLAGDDPDNPTGLFNGPDAASFYPPGSYAAGTTAAPRLTGITRTTSGSGSTASVTIRFTYSGTVDRGAGGYYVYTDGGERVQLTTCSVPVNQGGDDIDCTVSASSAAQYDAARAAEFAGAEYDAIRPAGQGGGANADDASSGTEHGGTIG